jgi:hypothetical protein
MRKSKRKRKMKRRRKKKKKKKKGNAKEMILYIQVFLLFPVNLDLEIAQLHLPYCRWSTGRRGDVTP